MHVTEPVRATIPVQNGARLSWDSWIGEMQMVNRPRKEGPSKNAMLLSQGKNVMQITQVLNAQNKVHIKRESVLQLNC